MPRKFVDFLYLTSFDLSLLICYLQVCVPHQPYRRGDVGPMSIRLMATSDQPLWRLFAEIVLRLPIVHPRGKDSEGKGRGRLWKNFDDEDSSEGDGVAPSR